ncbi:MAG: DNA polymerase domain-containing protein, partial [Chloroflexota bacterium]
PWQLEPSQPPLRILSIEPDVNPRHAEPAYLTLQYGRTRCQLSLAEPRPLLVNIKAILGRYDPDLILSAWGDTWMLPMLIKLSEDWKIPLALNRDPNQKIAFHNERTYFSYGQIIYRGQQVHLFGRWHVDVYNAMMFHDYEMEGIWELARVTALPVQTVARVSPGTGISSMQILTALRQGVLVPWHKQQVEYSKSALELLNADRGGLVYQPLVGLHQNVAEIDFISMYPSIMARHNISPETTEWRCDSHEWEPQAATEPPGLIPQTLTPLLEKRIALKQHLMYLSHWDPQYKLDKARAAAHKWLLVTCFGYLGYKNARFGRIEAHEAVTAYGREALLRAKEAAEDMGFTVLHMYVDGMWIQKPGYKTPSAFQPLLDEIVKRTGLPIALDGIYRQIAFLPSQVNPRLPVANRYFGVFQDGSLKLRGIEARRQDTPPFIVETQMEILKLFSKANTLKELHSLLPEIIALIRQRLEDLRSGRIPTAKMFVTQKIGRELGEYRVLSPAARALGQLEAIGKQIKPGQHIRFLYTLGKPGVHAWDLPETLDPQRLDVPRYTELLLRAGATILQPLGIQEKSLQIWVTANVSPDAARRLL